MPRATLVFSQYCFFSLLPTPLPPVLHSDPFPPSYESKSYKVVSSALRIREAVNSLPCWVLCELTCPIHPLAVPCSFFPLCLWTCCSLLVRHPLVPHLSIIPGFSYGSASVAWYVINPFPWLYIPLVHDSGQDQSPLSNHCIPYISAVPYTDLELNKHLLKEWRNEWMNELIQYSMFLAHRKKELPFSRHLFCVVSHTRDLPDMIFINSEYYTVWW